MNGIFTKEKVVNKVVLVEIANISANTAQPRSTFEQEAIEQLASSIHQNGLLQPLSVRRLPSGKLELIAGERRLRALRLLGERDAPCIIIEADKSKSAVLALIENIQRQDLNVFEQAAGIEALIRQWGITQEQAAKKLAMSQSAIANKLRLLKLSPVEKEVILKAKLTERHARALIRILDEEKRIAALKIIIQRQYNVTQTDQYIDQLLNKQKTRQKPKLFVKDIRLFLNTINLAVDTMKRSGVAAQTVKNENEEYIEYMIKIPKLSAVR